MPSVSRRMKDTLLFYLYAVRRRKAHKKLLATGNETAVAMGHALSASSSQWEGNTRLWRNRIESIRTELSRSEAVLDAWDRPWLDRSKELQERLGVSSNSDRVADGMTVSRAVRASKPEAECRLLFNLVLQLRPSVVVELGTNVGISGLYMAAALQEIGEGTLVTLEGSGPKAALAQENFKRLGVHERVKLIGGDFYETLPQLLEEYNTSIDLAFIDGFHDGGATIDFHERFASSMAEGILVYDDIRWSDGMAEAWQHIKSTPCVQVSVDAGSVGVCAVGMSTGDVLHLEWDS